MTSDEIGRMTIAELESAASRVSAALAILRSVGVWIGAPDAPKPEAPKINGTGLALVPGPPVVEFSPAERAERDRLLKQMRPELPPDIAALEDA